MKTLGCFVMIYLFCIERACACPGCKDAVAKLGQIWTSMGFNWSILFMLAVPTTLVASFGGALYFFYRKSQKNLHS